MDLLKKGWLAVWCVGLAAPACAGQSTPAFPTAEGFGAFARGGRGGKVLFVTNLADYIPRKEKPVRGSLRAACEAKGPRTVVFRVSGTIDLKAPLAIAEPYLTLAGQTAPGAGVCVRKYGTMIVGTHDVIVRHVRFRPGDEVGRRLARQRGQPWETDALSAHRCRNVILDHCSTSWANDEVLSLTECTDVTVQWCLITESLHRSTHAKGPHGYGGLVAYMADARISQHHNLWAFHTSRCPRPGTDGHDDGPGLLYDFRNNVIYLGGRGYSAKGGDRIRMNYVGNCILRSTPFVATRGVRMYQAGNRHNGKDTGWRMIRGHCRRMAAPFKVAPVRTDPADRAFARVLAEAGAALPTRDAVDRRVVEWTRKGRGGIIDSQQQVGGWPQLASARPPRDSDDDGMPDKWERQHGLDPNVADHNLDADGDGYTNLEEYLNRTDPNRPDGK